MNKEIVYALIYCRVSSEKQRTEGNGLESQEQRCQTYARSKGYLVESVFKDSFTGGGDFMNRPAMNELIHYLDKYPYKQYVVIFDDLKRFARDTIFHLKLRSAFKARGATPECLNFTFDDSPEGMFVETVLAASGELEKNQNKRQVIQKQRARLEGGYWPFVSPPGYYMKQKDPLHGTILEYKDEATLSLIREGLEGFAHGRFQNQLDVKKFLEQNTYCGRKHVALTSVKNLLTNILYAGYIEFPKWEVTRREAHHKGIISLETYEQIQDKLNGKAKVLSRKDMREDFPLRGCVVCSDCSKPYTASWAKGRNGKHPYYHCSTKGCIAYGKSIRKSVLEDAYQNVLKELAPKSITLELVKTRAMAIWDKKVKELEITKSTLQKTIGTNDERISSLAKMASVAKTQSIVSVYEKEIEKLVKENEEVQQKLTKMNRNLPDFGTAFDKVAGFIKSPYTTWENGDMKTKHTISNMVFHSKPSYDRKNGFGTADYAVVIKLFEQFATNNSKNVRPHGFEPWTVEV